MKTLSLIHQHFLLASLLVDVLICISTQILPTLQVDFLVNGSTVLDQFFTERKGSQSKALAYYSNVASPFTLKTTAFSLIGLLSKYFSQKNKEL